MATLQNHIDTLLSRCAEEAELQRQVAQQVAKLQAGIAVLSERINALKARTEGLK